MPRSERMSAATSVTLLALLAASLCPTPSSGQQWMGVQDFSWPSGWAADADTCAWSLFIWEPLPENATARDRVTVNRDMLDFCAEFDSDNPTAEWPGEGRSCTLVFLGSSSLPSVMVSVHGCCAGEVATEAMVVYPGIAACRDQLPGEELLDIEVNIIGVPTTTPPPETPVPTVTVDPSGNATKTISGVATIQDGLSDWRFWLPLLLMLLLMVLWLLCCCCWLCGKHRRKEKNDTYLMSQVVDTKRRAVDHPLLSTPPPMEREAPVPVVATPTKTSRASSVVSSKSGSDAPMLPRGLAALRDVPPSSDSGDIAFSDTDDGFDPERYLRAKDPPKPYPYQRPPPLPTRYNTVGITEPAIKYAMPDYDARSVSTEGGEYSPLEDVVLPIARMQREGRGDDSTSDASSIRPSAARWLQ
mmetsp:Transcript_3409/g.9801  ORF Transcript_3409/g.9801 Transcript_3409/m.9801 type:complete len:415 (+) Transcript_3409:493-1737(+)